MHLTHLRDSHLNIDINKKSSGIVMDKRFHFEGTGVVAHVADTLAQQEQNVFIAASL
jgi:hypothetical protein